jgi:hypothetical protein
VGQRRIKIQLPGGLGNQLFAYFAGLYFAEAVDGDLIVDLSGIDYSHVQGDFDVRSFTLDGRVTRVLPASRMRKFTNSLTTRFINFDPFFGSKIKAFQNLFEDDRLLARSEVKYIYTNRKNKFLSQLSLRGYFQDFGFLHGSDEIVSSLKLRNPSNWFLSMQEEFEREDVLAMHIRLGDLTVGKNFDLLGTLSEEYYKNAFEILSSRANFSKVYVFSDNPSLAMAILSGLDLRIEIVTPPPPSDPAESLVLMSRATGLVLGNSTFSFWAGVLSDSRYICYPSLFTRADLYTPKNFPEYWIPVVSSWREKQ